MAATPPKRPEAIQITVDWDQAGELPPVMASNVILVQQTPHEFILTFGFATPPIWLTPPTPEQIANAKTIKPHPIVRLGMSPGRVVELLQVLQQQLAAYQQTQQH